MLRRLRLGRPRPSTSPGPRSSPGSATSPSWSGPTPRRRASSLPVGGDRPDDPDWLRFRLLGATNPTYFALYARRRMEMYGATQEDFALVKAKNSRHGLTNPNARYHKEFTVEDVLALARSWPTRCTCSTSAPPPTARAAVVLSSMDYARTHDHDAGAHRRHLDGHARPTPRPSSRCPTSRPTPRPPSPRPTVAFRDAIAQAAYEEAGLGPDDLDLAEVYDLSSALELDWYENIGLCKEGEAERLHPRRRHRDRWPHPGQPERRAGLLRRGHPRPGHRPGVRAHLAAPRPGRRPPGRRRQGRAHRSTRACSATARRSSSPPDRRATGPPTLIARLGRPKTAQRGRRSTLRPVGRSSSEPRRSATISDRWPNESLPGPRIQRRTLEPGWPGRFEHRRTRTPTRTTARVES